MKPGFVGRMFTGILIIGIGVMFLLRQLGYIAFDAGSLFSTYWPVILIYIGLFKIIGGRGFGGTGASGLVPLMIGLVFLAKNLDFLELSPGEIIRFAIPVVIIFIGLKLLLKSSPKKREAPQEDEWKSYRPYNNDRPVPPAPPLHPDPTGKFDSESMEQPHENGRHGFEQHNAGPGAYQEPQRNPESDNKRSDWSKWGEYNKDDKREKYEKYEKYEKHAKHEHVEWWNPGNPDVVSRSGFIGDIHMGHEYWELKPLNISHFIGDTVLDLTKAQIPYGETKINISSFIGDVKVYVPDDCELGILVVSNTFIGDVKVLGRKEGGMMANVSIQTPRYSEADKKIKLVVSSFIGDTRVTKVG